MPNNQIVKKYIFDNNKGNVIKFRKVPSSRKILPSLETKCQKEWLETVLSAKKTGKNIWDSSVYRFENIHKSRNQYIVKVSEIPFSIRLMLNKHSRKIKKLGTKYAPLGIFTSCFITTKDGFYVFVKKSKKYHFGHDFAFIGGIVSKEDCPDTDALDIFAEAKREVFEEVGLRQINIEKVQLLAGYITSNFNFCFLFKITTKLDSKKINEIFSLKKDGEAEKLISIPLGSIRKFSRERLNAKDRIKLKFL